MPKKALIIEDDANIRELLRLYLEKDGFEVFGASDGSNGLREFKRVNPDLVMLDIMLPVMDGWQVCREIRRESSTPIIMLTAKGETVDKISGLEMGADDYVTKPFSMRELVARVRAVLRRMAAGLEMSASAVMEKSGIRLDAERHEVTVDQQSVTLSPKEFALLTYMMRHSGRVRTREEILQAVWGEENLLDERTVDVHIRWLRMKIEQDPAHPTVLLTVRGIGYKFVDLS